MIYISKLYSMQQTYWRRGIFWAILSSYHQNLLRAITYWRRGIFWAILSSHCWNFLGDTRCLKYEICILFLFNSTKHGWFNCKWWTWVNWTACNKLTEEELSSEQYSLLIARTFSEPPGVYNMSNESLYPEIIMNYVKLTVGEKTKLQSVISPPEIWGVP